MKMWFVLIVMQLLTQNVMASSPLSIQRFHVGVEKDTPIKAYAVKCDNGRVAWINSRGEWPQKQWCIGVIEERECKTGRTEKVTVAKLACNE